MVDVLSVSYFCTFWKLLGYPMVDALSRYFPCGFSTLKSIFPHLYRRLSSTIAKNLSRMKPALDSSPAPFGGIPGYPGVGTKKYRTSMY